MTKFRLFFNKDEETMWLNEMARNGYAMVGYAAGVYSFERCQPGEYAYQIDITEGMFRVSNNYREFMQEAGIEIVCLWGRWVILRKKAAEGEFVLYTDVESSIEHYTNIEKMFKVATAIECSCLIMEAWAFMASRKMGALVFSFILAAILLVFIKEIMRVSDIVDDLKERIGESPRGRRKRPSILIPMGLVINGLGVAITTEAIGSYGALLEGLKGFCHMCAIVLMVIGMVRTIQCRQ